MKISLADRPDDNYAASPFGGLPADNPFARGDCKLRWLDRLVLMTLASVLAAMLATAWRLSPDPRGMGTHQQLGLAPCTVVQWFGIRCPSCGMTTSWTHAMHGELIQAARVNAGGTLLALVSMVSVPWLLAAGVAGRWLVTRPRETWLFGTALAVMVVTLVQWAVRVGWGW